MRKSKNQEPGITWRQPDGRPVSCEEKLAMLNENWMKSANTARKPSKTRC